MGLFERGSIPGTRSGRRRAVEPQSPGESIPKACPDGLSHRTARYWGGADSSPHLQARQDMA